MAEGIEMCEDKCPCGGSLRLHSHVFGSSLRNPIQKYYIDCDARCGRVIDWMNSPDEAIEEFDKQYPN